MEGPFNGADCYFEGGKEICLICNSVCGSEESNGLSGSLSSTGILGKDLNVYFILKHVLELPSERMEYFLRYCLEPLEEWVKICGACGENYVEKCRRTFGELMEVKKRFLEARMELIGGIKKSAEMGTRRGRKGNGGNCTKEQIRKETRQFVRLHEYSNSGGIINSFNAGDEMAREKAVSSKMTKGEGGTDKNGTLENITPTFLMNLKEEPELSMMDTSDNEDWEPEHELAYSSISNKEGDSDRKEPEVTPSFPRTATKGDESWKQKKVRSSFPRRIPKKGEDQDWDADGVPDLNVEESTDDEEKVDRELTYKRKSAKIKKGKKKAAKTMEEKLLERTCPICNMVVSTKTKLKRHMYRRHNDKREKFSCDQCPKVFYNQPSLFNHLGFAHGIKDQLRFPCSYEGCEQAFFYLAQLLDHEAEVHSDSPPNYKCTTCQEAFHTPKYLRQHQKKHETEGLRPFLCDLCPGKFRTKYALGGHMKTYHDSEGTEAEQGKKRRRREPQNYKCSECNGDFHNCKGLQRHLEIVHGVIKSIEELRGVRIYQCSQCGVVLCDQTSLTKHIEGQHEKKLQVCCEVCGKILANSQCLRLHMYKLHKIGDIDMKKHPCTVEGCSQAFQNESTLKMHIITIHERKRTYKCEFCGKDFFSSSNLRRHIKAMHVNSEQKPFSCDECGKSFAINEYLWQHNRTHHRATQRAGTSTEPVPPPVQIFQT